MGELIGVPSYQRPSPELRSARNDPAIMAEWLRRSFAEWLAAECTSSPMLVVLEDLHWGDLPSVTYLGDAQRALAAKPLMMLALARPEIHESFPSLWKGTGVPELPLGGLTPRAAERLVRAALGDGIAADTVSRIVERADGNAFYLEELIRRVAEGDDNALPETVLALVHSRLERLDADTRRIVRAASVFGELFSRDGVAVVLGLSTHEGDFARSLQALLDGELFAPAHESGLPLKGAYLFRHGLVREAAYRMLTDADRAIGHRLAGEWLERTGARDPLTLADHFELGGEPARAVPWLVSAAQTALDGGNLPATLAIGDRAIDCGGGDALRDALGRMRAAALTQVRARRRASISLASWDTTSNLAAAAALASASSTMSEWSKWFPIGGGIGCIFGTHRVATSRYPVDDLTTSSAGTHSSPVHPALISYT
jgi:predicted ATPase